MNEKDRMEQLEKILGKKPRAADLARYLGVTKGAVSQYDPVKRELMLLGLWVKKYLKAKPPSRG